MVARGLVDGGLEVVLLEKRHVKAAPSAMPVKTDRKDARGIAQLLRMGWYRPVHAKSADAQEVRALVIGRKLLQAKLLLDVELSIRGILRGKGGWLGQVGEIAEELEAVRVEGGAQRLPKQPPKQAGQHAHGQKRSPACTRSSVCRRAKRHRPARCNVSAQPWPFSLRDDARAGVGRDGGAASRWRCAQAFS